MVLELHLITRGSSPGNSLDPPDSPAQPDLRGGGGVPTSIEPHRRHSRGERSDEARRLTSLREERWQLAGLLPNGHPEEKTVTVSSGKVDPAGLE